MSQTSPPPSLHCTRCADQLPPGYQPGLCPVCLMDLAMRPTHDVTLPVAPPQKPLTPEELAPHFPQLEILECIGRGGMGVVYKARQKTLNRLVALKLLAPEQKKDAAFAERFAHEARALAALNHPNIVTVYDFGETGGFFYLLMEFVDGVNLRQAMRGSHLTPEQALTIVPPICEALQYAHEHGIVHRDIKPENLLLDKAGRVKIADFGIAKMMGSEKASMDDAQAGPSPHATVVAGTPEYMAPEQRSASATTDHRADIYSLGVVLYELLTGRRPPSSLELPLPEAGTKTLLDEIVRRALEVDPAQRYQTVAELQQHLATLTKPPPPAQIWSRTRYERWLSRTLRAAGLLWMLYGLGRLLGLGFSLPRLRFMFPPSLATMPQGLWAALPLWAAAWALIRWRDRLTRLSYRQLTVKPSRVAELGAFGIRLYGLWLFISAFSELTRLATKTNPALFEDTILMLFGAALFSYEHVFAPILHALPLWKPLPFAQKPPRRTLCAFSAAAGLLLALLLWLLVMLVQKFSERMAYTQEWADVRAEDLFSTVVRIAWVSAIVSVVGWAALRRIRHSGGHLYGMATASAAAFAFPLVLLFSTLVFILYSSLSRRHETHAYLPDGSVQTTLLPQPELLVQISLGAGLLCLVCWVGLLLKLRRLPSLAPVALPARRLGLLAVPVWFLAFATPVFTIMALTSRSLPRVTIPEEQFARHAERQLNMQLFSAGFQHDLPQGFLKLPRPRETTSLKLPGLRDAEGHQIDSRLNLWWLLNSTWNSLQITGHDELGKIRMEVDRTPPFPLLRDVVVPSVMNSRRYLLWIWLNRLIDAPEYLQARLQSGPAALTAADYTWLDQNHVDLMADPHEEGALLLLGGAVQVTAQAPKDFCWLSLDDRQVAAALTKARAMRDARPAGQGFIRIREHSPALIAFVTRHSTGLLENLGPTKPGAKDLRLRVHLLDGRPFH